MTNTLTISRELADELLVACSSMGWTVAEKLRAILAAPAVERQEPVAIYMHEDDVALFNSEDVSGGVAVVGKRPGDGMTALYTSPPAPAPVSVVPDDLAQNAKRYEWIRSQNIGHCEINRVLFETISDDCNPPYRSLKYGKDLDAAIDACLDKVKELNQ